MSQHPLLVQPHTHNYTYNNVQQKHVLNFDHILLNKTEKNRIIQTNTQLIHRRVLETKTKGEF